MTVDLKQRVNSYIEKLSDKTNGKTYKLMEVCGTHTMAIFRFGIRNMLPKNIKLLSGPGCPVCVTPVNYIDQAIEYARGGNTILTFGDMFKVPGSSSSLANEKANGYDIRMVYSPIQAVETAKDNPELKIIFLGIGFETTAPAIAASIIEAEEKGLNNYFVYCGNKTIPKALKTLSKGSMKIDGFILPGHVSAIIGSDAYLEVAKETGIPGVVTGFEPLDIIEGIDMLIEPNGMSIKNQYKRVVDEKGNPTALKILEKVMEPSDNIWRGIGVIPGSGLKIRKRYGRFDAAEQFGVNETLKASENKNCRCGQVLQGLIEPSECKLFGKGCKPEHPIGPCMVSSEGSCAAHYKYGSNSGIRH